MTEKTQNSEQTRGSTGTACSSSAFMVGQVWDLGRYGLRRIESVEKRYVPFPSRERMCSFGTIETLGGPAALVVGSKTLKSCYRHVG